MNLYSLAHRNIKLNSKKYLMYFFSLSFSVFTTYTFIALIYNESVRNAFTYSDRYQALLLSFGVIIMVFVLFFLISSNTSFIKARKREISTYSLFGMTDVRIGKLLFIETMMVGIATLAVGIGTGIFFSKLIAMVLLDLSLASYTGHISFAIDPMSIFITIGVFLVIFSIMGFSGFRIIHQFELVDLFKAEKKSEGVSKGSYGLLTFSFLVVGLGYYLAAMEDANKVVTYAFLIITLVVVGTYLFFWGGLPKVFSLIKRDQTLYYKGDRLISTASFSHQMTTISSLMATIAVLSAVATTAIATGYTLYSNIEENTYEMIGYDMYYYGGEEGLLEQVYASFNEHDATVIDAYSVEMFQTAPKMQNVFDDSRTYITSEDNYFRVYSETEYNQLISLSQTRLQPLNVKQGTVTYTHPSLLSDMEQAILGHELHFSEHMLEITAALATGLGTFGGLHNLILHDDDFQVLRQTGDVLSTDNFAHVFNFTNALTSGALNEDLNLALAGNAGSYRTAYNHYSETMEVFGLVCFIGFFMSGVFILMTASLLYFKQVMAAEEEKHQYKMLRKIGMNAQVERRVITQRLLPVFLIPLLIGILHSIFAMKAADTIVFTHMITVKNSYLTVLGFSAIMYVVYAIVYGVFYYITKAQYSRIVR